MTLISIGCTVTVGVLLLARCSGSSHAESDDRRSDEIVTLQRARPNERSATSYTWVKDSVPPELQLEGPAVLSGPAVMRLDANEPVTYTITVTTAPEDSSLREADVTKRFSPDVDGAYEL